MTWLNRAVSWVQPDDGAHAISHPPSTTPDDSLTINVTINVILITVTVNL